MEVTKQPGVREAQAIADARHHPRFRLEIDICVYPRNSPVVRGHTVDISESGISAMLREEVPVGEVVRLTFALPEGEVDVQAAVRQRIAFRYGFQFLEAGAVQNLITRACRDLAIRQVVSSPPR
jgi:hypothetical protein